MEAELAELLKRATAAFAEHGDSQVFFVVHKVDDENRVIDHREWPVTAHSSQSLGGVKGPEGHFSCGLFFGNDERNSVPEWLAVANSCGAWILASRGTNVSPLADPASLWAIELLRLPRKFGAYIKSVWYCNAFAANVVMLRMLQAGTTELTFSANSSKGEAANCGPSNAPAENQTLATASYQDPDNYQRNVWLYELRKSGMTNAAIRAELDKRATEFSTLESENALRNAIESIAVHHGWPLLQGKAGRPKTSKRNSDG